MQDYDTRRETSDADTHPAQRGAAFDPVQHARQSALARQAQAAHVQTAVASGRARRSPPTPVQLKRGDPTPHEIGDDGVPAGVPDDPAPARTTDAGVDSEPAPALSEPEPAAAPTKKKLIVRWRGKFGGDLSAEVGVKPEKGQGDSASATVEDDDAEKGAATQTLEKVFTLNPAPEVRITVTPTAEKPEDRYMKTVKKAKVPDTEAKESRHTIVLKVNRENEKNVVDVWKKKGIDPAKAGKVTSQTLLGRKVQLNVACESTVEKTNTAFEKLDDAKKTEVKDSIVRLGGYNKRTTAKGGFSNHSVGCAIDINYNMPTKQNHHFFKKKSRDARLLAFVQKVVRTDPTLADFDIWKSKGQTQLDASKAFGRLFPGYLQSLLDPDAAASADDKNKASPGAGAPSTTSDAPEKGAETDGAATPVDDEAPAEPGLDLSAVTAASLKRARKKEKDKARKAELQLVKDNLRVLKAWVLGTTVKKKELVGMVPLHEKLLEVMTTGGWSWGGDWSSAKDYMHFEDKAAMKSLKKTASKKAASKKSADAKTTE